jgi:hypothetical protein
VKKTMNSLSLRVTVAAFTAGVAMICISGCSKKEPENAAAAGGAAAPAGASTVTPEVQAQINATQKADAARHAAMAAQANQPPK